MSVKRYSPGIGSFMVLEEQGDYVEHFHLEKRDELVRELVEALENAEYALKMSYDVCDYPGNGTSTQDAALRSARAVLAKAKTIDAGDSTKIGDQDLLLSPDAVGDHPRAEDKTSAGRQELRCVSCDGITVYRCENCGAPICTEHDSGEFGDVLICDDKRACDVRIGDAELAKEQAK